uniref:Ig-like domain-containing protein n=1 Tax=Mola mola TaxID=94237 RepID=A0A3Q3WFX6_MOLML
MWRLNIGALAFVLAEVKLYKKVGDDVVLQASPLPSTIISISWKESVNIAVQWEGNEIMYYRQFRERGSLNISSGELTITKLARGDSNLYTPEINNVIMAPTQLIVISPVPKPTISSSYNSDDVLVLTCNGGAMDSEPISYKWRSSGKELSNSSKELNITKVRPLSSVSHRFRIRTSDRTVGFIL